jgi:hypothetical protein
MDKCQLSSAEVTVAAVVVVVVAYCIFVGGRSTSILFWSTVCLN